MLRRRRAGLGRSERRAPPDGALLVQYVLFAQIGGGVLMLSGFLARWAAAAQLPILAWSVLVFLRGHGDATPVDPPVEWATLVVAGLIGP